MLPPLPLHHVVGSAGAALDVVARRSGTSAFPQREFARALLLEDGLGLPEVADREVNRPPRAEICPRTITNGHGNHHKRQLQNLV